MQPGQVVSGRFRVIREAGRGGMGTVFCAVDLHRDEAQVALKMLSRPEDALDDVARGRFDREIACLAELDDPRIVRYIAHGVADGQTWLAEEWIDGESLVERLDGDGLELPETIALTMEVARGLAVAHAADIVHRDVKPQNILLVNGDPNRVKLIDFGIARRVVEPFRLTRTGTIVGTPGYFSPEQIRGEPIGPGTDVFALGCVLYECVTGLPPFSGRSLTAVRTKVLLYEPLPLSRAVPGVPLVLSNVVAQMMAKDEAERPSDGAATAALLEELPPMPAGLNLQARLPAMPTRTRSSIPGGGTTTDTAAMEAVAAVVIASSSALPSDFAAVVHAAGCQLETLPDNTLLVTPRAHLSSAEQVRAAARCALVLRSRLDGPIILSGWTQASDPRAALSSAIDRGASALTSTLADTSPVDPSVRVDGGLRGLLEADFDVQLDEHGGCVLRGERRG